MTLHEKLLGALIGIARATDGSDHLICPESTAVIMDALAALHHNAGEEMFGILLQQAEDVKRNMVPDCFLCANPCGRTSDYDMADLQRLPEHIRQQKIQMLNGICQLAADRKQTDFYYKALIVIGMDDFPKPRLDALMEELDKLLQ